MMVEKLLSQHKTASPTDLKYKLTPYHSKPLHLYGIPKIRKPDIPLRPIVSSIGSPCYAMAGFLQKILSPPAGKSESFAKNSANSLQLLKSVDFQSPDTLISFDVVSLFTNLSVDEALQVITNKLHNDVTLAEPSVLQIEGIRDLLEVCFRTRYFQADDTFFQQKDGLAAASSVSPIVINIYVKHFEKLALDSTQHRSSLWLLYIDDIFMVWPHGPERLQNFLIHLCSLRSSVIRKETTLDTEVYRKPTHTGQYLIHPPHVKRFNPKSSQ
jgi:hypothetical protein